MKDVQTLKGFRDFLPKETRKRQFVLETLKKVFESYGFEPLETPALEYEEVLTGKYGNDGDKLMYRFEDNGKRKVAMRYDQTVPLARVVAQYQNELSFPFKRYQIQNVWRAENTQKGRYREFLQVDIDTVGSSSLLVDLEIIEIVYNSFKKLGLDIIIKINDRRNLNGIDPKFLRIIDKLNKISEESVIKELKELNAEEIFTRVSKMEPPQYIVDLMSQFQKNGYPLDALAFDNKLVRGLEYYTGLIIEIVRRDDVKSPAIGGGGRYDNLIGMFAERQIPAVGFSFGFDRLVEAMEELDLFPKNLNQNNMLVAFSSSELQEQALEIANKLRLKNVNAEFYLDDANLEKQLKYADKKQIPFVLIVDKNKLNLKNMNSGNQEKVNIEDVPDKIA